MVWRDGLFACPAAINDLSEFVRDVDAPDVSPAILKPDLELVACIVIEHVYVQLALLRQAGESQIAASDKADAGVIGVGAMNQIQLGV